MGRSRGYAGASHFGTRVTVTESGSAGSSTLWAKTAAAPYQPNGRFLQWWMVRAMFQQRLINIVVSSVVGPPAPVCFAGARLHEVFQLSALQGYLGLGVGVLSYAKGLYLDIAADVDVVPVVEAFATGIFDALDQLGTTTTE